MSEHDFGMIKLSKGWRWVDFGEAVLKLENGNALRLSNRGYPIGRGEWLGWMAEFVENHGFDDEYAIYWDFLPPMSAFKASKKAEALFPK